VIWKHYRNELIVLASILLMLLALFYKGSAVGRLDRVDAEVKRSMMEIGEIIALKKQWGDTTLTKKIGSLRENLSPEKIKRFSVKGKKLYALLEGLSDREVNGIILKLENTAVQLTKLDVRRKGKSYRMEIRCKW